MIVGCGTDIVHIPRIESLLERFGQRFLDKVFHPDEQSACKQRYASANTKLIASYYAKRFAAKEAYAKAIGTGFGQDMAIASICVGNDANGKPILQMAGMSSTVHLSMSDDYPYATAMVVIEK